MTNSDDLLAELVACGVSPKTILAFAKLIADAEYTNTQRERARNRMRIVRERARTHANGSEQPLDRDRKKLLLTEERSLSKKETISAQNVSFDRFWSAYPKRKGSNPKQPARKAFDRAIQRVSADTLIAAANAYASADADKVDSPYICQAVTWLNQARWEQYEPKLKSPVDFEAMRRANGGQDARTTQQTTLWPDTRVGQNGRDHATQLRPESGGLDGPSECASSLSASTSPHRGG